MKTVTTWLALIAGLAASATIASPAKAISLSYGGTHVVGEGMKSSISGAKTIDFNSGSAPTSGIATYSTASGAAATVVNTSVSGQHAMPNGDTSYYLTSAPQGSSVEGATGDVVINFNKSLDYFGIYLGSVDAYNSIDFYTNNGVKTITGSDITSTPDGSWFSQTSNLYVNFLANPGETFNKVVLKTSGIAFETDNHAYREAAAKSVPEPGTIAGLLVMGAMGAGSLLKRKRLATIR
jgi:hypothetical protein